MATGDDVIMWKDVATSAAAVISGAAVFIVGSFTRRLDKHEQEDRETFAKLFGGLNDISEKVSDGFRGIDDNINKTHIKLLERISDVQQDKKQP